MRLEISKKHKSLDFFLDDFFVLYCKVVLHGNRLHIFFSRHGLISENDPIRYDFNPLFWRGVELLLGSFLPINSSSPPPV